MSHTDNESKAGAVSIELHTSAAMLISVFGQPERADAEVNSFRWRLTNADGSNAQIFSQQTGAVSAAKVQPWQVEGSSQSAIEQVQEAMQAGENYYDGVLHPELFIKRHG